MKFKTALRFGPAVLLALVAATFFMAEARPQQPRRNRPSRRATAPAPAREVLPAPTPLPQEPSVVRTAEDVLQDEDTPPRRRSSRTRRNAAQEADEREDMRNTVDKLTQTVTRLSDELSNMKGEQRALVELERLTRAEQRAETLRAQLRDVTDKEFVLQDRMAQLEVELEPGSIERRSLLIGSLNPSAVREQIRLSLQREKERVQRQLELLATSRVRLESAVASADQEVERIKARIDAVEQRQIEANAAGSQPAPTPTPTSNPPAEPPQE